MRGYMIAFLRTSLFFSQIADVHTQNNDSLETDEVEAEFIFACQKNASLIASKLSSTAGFELKTDLRSLEYLDDFVTRVFSDTGEEQLGSLPSVIGCFLGEVIINEIGGKWVSTSEFGYAIELREGTLAFPFNTAYDHLVNGPEDSILGFFGAFKVMSEEKKTSN